MTRPSLEAAYDAMDKRLIINVGRQFGSGGKQVADEIGRILGIKVFDNELVVKAAEESGFSRELFARTDEKKRFLTLSNIFSSNRFGSTTGNCINDNELFRIQSEVIRGIARREDAIFVGRAADYILRDMECLDVFICAPLENRVARVSERLGISEDEAETLIERKDRGREEYYNYLTFGNWGVASNYDLCIDSSILGIEGTAEFVIEFARRRGLLG